MDLRSQIQCNNYQKSLYQHWKQNRFSEIYHLPMSYEITGELDTRLFSQAFQDIFISQFAFGLKFREGAANEVACTYDAGCLPDINYHTIIGDDIHFIDHQIHLYKAKFFLRPFDLNKGKSFHIDLVQINKTDRHILLINCHSITCDTYILQEINRLVSKYYNNNETSHEKNLPFNMRKYLALNQYIMHFNKSANAYMKNEISKVKSGSFSCIDLLPESKNVSIKSLSINQDIKQKIENFCQAKNIQPYIFYLGCYQIFLNKSFNIEHLCTGIPVSNRPRKLFRDVAGYFVNTLPAISNINSTTVIDELLYQLKLNIFNIIKNKNADMKSAQGQENEPAISNNNYDNIFSFIKGNLDFSFNGCRVKSVPVTKRHLDHPLTMEVKEGSDDVQVNFISDSRISLGADPRDSFLKIISQVLNRRNSIVSDIRLKSDNTIYQDFVDPNDETAPSFSSSITDYISRKYGSIAFHTPEKVA